jgi:hypothetical protein
MIACYSPVCACWGCSGGAPTPAARAPRYVYPPLAFDTFMSYVNALGAVPYLVLNYDSGNFASGPNDWTYAKLLDLAVSWLSYIVRQGHKARGARAPLPCVWTPVMLERCASVLFHTLTRLACDAGGMLVLPRRGCTGCCPFFRV